MRRMKKTKNLHINTIISSSIRSSSGITDGGHVRGVISLARDRTAAEDRSGGMGSTHGGTGIGSVIDTHQIPTV
jgi:hypothetical protein